MIVQVVSEKTRGQMQRSSSIVLLDVGSCPVIGECVRSMHCYKKSSILIYSSYPEPIGKFQVTENKLKLEDNDASIPLAIYQFHDHLNLMYSFID